MIARVPLKLQEIIPSQHSGYKQSLSHIMDKAQHVLHPDMCCYLDMKRPVQCIQ